MSTNILLYGKAGAGKDSVADVLREFGYRLGSLASFVRSEFERHHGRWPKRSDRAQLIDMAETYKRLYGHDIWVRQLCDTYRDAIDESSFRQPFAITDGRYQVEYDHFVTRLGFASVRVWAPDDVRYERLIARDGFDQRDILAGHEDELDYVRSDFVISNDGSLSRLRRQVIEMLSKLNGGAS